MARKIILETHLSPGDICTLTAAIESLHKTYPSAYLTGVRTSCDELFLHSPHISVLDELDADVVEMHYTDLVNCSSEVPNHFLRGYCYDLGKKLGIPLELKTNRPHLYLSEDERFNHPLPLKEGGGILKYWLVMAGVKRDYTLKQWPVEYYQEVIDRLYGRVQFVQVGRAEDIQPELHDVINLVGKTSIRQLLALGFHAEGGLGPITLLQHICAGFERPYIALLGGREPLAWTQYPLQTTLHTFGKLHCCRVRACWKSRVVQLNDGSEQDKRLCDEPRIDYVQPVGACMAMITPADVVRVIESYGDERFAPRSIAPIQKHRAPHECPESRDRIDEPTLAMIAYSAWGFETKIVPAWTSREWMDLIEGGYPYGCLPMVMANQSGWFVLTNHDLVAQWNGGPLRSDMLLTAGDSSAVPHAQSAVGFGILTWIIPYVFRTPKGWNLLCRGPANYFKHGVVPLEGLVEADWTCSSFSMNWKFTQPGRCEFKKGDPIAMLVPQKRKDLEMFVPRFVEMESNHDVMNGYNRWIESRRLFEAGHSSESAASADRRFRGHYQNGCTPDGVFFAEHQRHRDLKIFGTTANRSTL